MMSNEKTVVTSPPALIVNCGITAVCLRLEFLKRLAGRNKSAKGAIIEIAQCSLFNQIGKGRLIINRRHIGRRFVTPPSEATNARAKAGIIMSGFEGITAKLASFTEWRFFIREVMKAVKPFAIQAA